MPWSAFTVLVAEAHAALRRFDGDRSTRAAEHEEYCTCHRCVFVRGMRGELAAYEKAQAKLERAREKEGKR